MKLQSTQSGLWKGKGREQFYILSGKKHLQWWIHFFDVSCLKNKRVNKKTNLISTKKNDTVTVHSVFFFSVYSAPTFYIIYTASMINSTMPKVRFLDWSTASLCVCVSQLHRATHSYFQPISPLHFLPQTQTMFAWHSLSVCSCITWTIATSPVTHPNVYATSSFPLNCSLISTFWRLKPNTNTPTRFTGSLLKVAPLDTLISAFMVSATIPMDGIPPSQS